MEVYSNLCEESKKNVIKATYKEMGKRSEKAIALHILKENLFEENLINDISNINYIKDNEGKTYLNPIPNLGIFVDDLYIYGYLGQEDIVFDKKGKVYCTQGENGSASCIVEILRTICKQTISKNYSPPHINIMHTITLENKESQTLTTIKQIERKRDVLQKWEERTGKKAKAVFVCKADVSNIPLQDLEKYIGDLENNLFALGYFIHSIDYTQDFSGTIDKKELIKYLTKEKNFKLQNSVLEEEYYEQDENKLILDNDRSVGKNVLTYLRLDGKQKTRTKFYNKYVSNIEAGYVRSQFGGHLFDTVCSTSERLRKVFSNKDVIERGVTRLEVSVYGEQERIGENIGEALIEKEFCLLNNERKLFYKQPLQKQWLSLVDVIDKCFILADRKFNTIYVTWYGNKTTGRLVGVKIDYSKAKDKENIENIIQWAASDFGFRIIPIYVVEILEYSKEEVIFSPLRCFCKGENSKTFLTHCSFPKRVCKEDVEIEDIFPKTKFVEWEVRKKKLPSYKDIKPFYNILEFPELAINKEISFLSFKDREARNLELEELKNNEIWRLETNNKINKKGEYLDYIKLKLKEKEEIDRIKKESLILVKEKFSDLNVKKITTQDVGEYLLYGWKKFDLHNMVLLRCLGKEEFKVLYANDRLIKFLLCLQPYFNVERNMYFYKSIRPGFNEKRFFKIIINEKVKFFNNNNKEIEYFPIEMDLNLNSFLSEEIGKIIKEENNTLKNIENKFVTYIEYVKEINKNAYKCVDLEEGDYFILAYSQTTFKNNLKTFVLLRKIKGKKTFYVSGYWLEQEIKKIEDKERLSTLPYPVPLHFGKIKTTPSKKKARTCIICYRDSKTQIENIDSNIQRE